MRQVDFFFGLGSRYSYLAATQVPLIARETGTRFVWRPLYSRVLIARAGRDPFAADDRRGQYDPAYRTTDAQRWARYYGVPYAEPELGRHRLAAGDGVRGGGAAGPCRAACPRAVRRVLRKGRASLRPGRAGAIGRAAGCAGRGVSRAADLGRGRAPARAEHFGCPGGRRLWRAELRGELFWGQDRLPLLRRHLAAER